MRDRVGAVQTVFRMLVLAGVALAGAQVGGFLGVLIGGLIDATVLGDQPRGASATVYSSVLMAALVGSVLGAALSVLGVLRVWRR